MAAFAISLPPIQNTLVYTAKNILERELGVEVNIGKVDVALPSYAVLEGLELKDLQGESFLKTEACQINLLTFSLWNFLYKRNQVQELYIDYIKVLKPEINIYRQKESGKMNIDFLSSDQEKSGSNPLVIAMPKVRILEGIISFHDSSSSNIDSSFQNRINFQKIDIDKLSGDFAIFLRPNGRMKIGINEFQLHEKQSDFRLTDLSVELEYDSSNNKPFFRGRELTLKTPLTDINADFSFPRSGWDEILDDETNEFFEVDFRDSKIDFSTIEYFLDEALPIKGTAYFNGEVHGDFAHLNSDGFSIKYGDSTLLNTEFSISDFTKKERLFLDIKLLPASFMFRDLLKLLPEEGLPEHLNSLARMDVEGSFKGKYFDFDAKGVVSSALGTAEAETHFVLAHNIPIATYRGKVQTTGFNLNAFLPGNQLVSQNINANLDIAGKGFNLSQIDTRISGSIKNSEIFNYNLDSATTQLAVNSDTFQGKLNLDDAEGSATINFQGDMNKLPLHVSIDGTVSELDLKHYEIYDQTIRLSSSINADVVADSSENLYGDIILTEILANREDKELKIPEIRLSSTLEESNNTHIKLGSRFLEADLLGQFTVPKATDLIGQLISESRSYFTNSDSVLRDYYANKVIDSTETEIQLSIIARDSLNSLFTFLDKPIYVQPESFIAGKLQFGILEYAEISAKIDTAAFSDWQIADGNWSLNIAKISNAKTLGITSGLEIKKIHYGNTFHADNASLYLDGSDDYIESDLFAQQIDQANRLQLKVGTIITDNKVVLSVDSTTSLIQIQKDTLWFTNTNSIVFSDSSFQVEDFNIRSRDGFIGINGEMSSIRGKRLNVNLSDINLAKFNDFLDLRYAIGGTINAKGYVEDVFEKPRVDLDGKLEQLSLESFLYGDVEVSSHWNQRKGKLDLKAELIDKGKSTLKMDGYYIPAMESSPLNIEVITENPFPLNYISPFVEGQLYSIEGNVALESFRVFGELDSIQVSGTGNFEHTSFGVDYFKTQYRMLGKIFFDRNLITLTDVVLFDKNNKPAIVRGDIYHKGLSEFIFDIEVDEVEDFLLMDTQKEDNDLFYGTIILKNAVASITGNIDQIDIQSFIISGAGTKLRIPLSEDNNYVQPEYISFVGDETTALQREMENLQGFTLNLTIKATEEAQVDLIFDEKAGDIISGRGNGTLNMLIDEKGEFAMSGEYEIDRGNYLFTSQNVINKRFTVKEGGTISWTGDPYDAQLDLDAYYSIYANLPFSTDNSSDAASSPRVPVDVLMHMKGSLMRPEIELSIQLPSVSEQELGQVASYFKAIQNDEQELNKQVFSLLVFNQFAPVGGFLGNNFTGNGVTTSISELLSNQLNYWLSQALDDKLSVNLGTNNFQNLNLLVQAKLFNNRVTIERDGALIDPNQSNLAVGNLSVVIKLLPTEGRLSAIGSSPGVLVLEVFNRSGFSEVQQSFENSSQTGIGIFFKKDFDNLPDLLGKRKKK